MNIEEKARAYDMALEKARKHYNSKYHPSEGPSGVYLNNADLEEMFPALKESEDDTIRESLIEFLTEIKYLSESGRTSWAIRENDAEMCKSFLDYLEKQKEQSITANDLDEEIHRFFDDCIDVHEAKLYGNISERVIPVDCYELTARHFAKWGEKQKENPKSADSIPSNCVSNVKCEDRWHKVKDSLPNSAREVLCKDAIGNFFIGRYKSTQSWEASMYDDCDKRIDDNPPVVKWCEIPLEEQKPAEIDEYEIIKKHITDDFLSSEVNKRLNECGWYVTDEKPAEWSEEDETYLQDALWCIEQAEKVAKDEGDMGACWSAEKWLKSLPERFNLQPKQEWSDDIIRKAVKEVGLTQHQIDWFKTNVFPPKQEWSDEDAAILKIITSDVARMMHKCGIGTDEWNIRSKAIRWLENLCPNQKSEWSEEDEIRLKEALEVLDESIKYLPAGYGFLEDVHLVKNWLKSLRHKPHTVSTKDATKFGNLEYERGVKDGIQSEKSRQWKPSKEQIRTLEYYMNVLNCNEHKEILFGLYEQLKELM